MYGGRTTRKAAVKAKTMASQVSRLQRQVALLRPETKYTLGGVTSTNVTAAAGTIFPLTNIAEGVSNNQRTGIEIRGVKLEMIFSYVRSSLPAGGKYRFLIVKDSGNIGAAPAISGTVGAVLETFVPQTAFLNNNSRERYSILYDKLVVVDELNHYKEKADVHRLKLRIPFPIRFSDASTAAADQGRNSLWMIILCDGADTGDFSTYWETGFTDV